MRTTMTPTQIETVAVVAGTSTTFATHLVALAIAATPLLQALALMSTIIVGLLTAIWTIKKIIKN
jgi:hypothetical protein